MVEEPSDTEQAEWLEATEHYVRDLEAEIKRLRAESCCSPWLTPPLDQWSIVGMNHYHLANHKSLFVAMARGGSCIQAEGPREDRVWKSLRQKAAEAVRDE